MKFALKFENSWEFWIWMFFFLKVLRKLKISTIEIDVSWLVWGVRRGSQTEASPKVFVVVLNCN